MAHVLTGYVGAAQGKISQQPEGGRFQQLRAELLDNRCCRSCSKLPACQEPTWRA